MSLRMDRVQDPIIPQVAGWIRENPGTISLGQGVVHYAPPNRCKELVDRLWEDTKNHLYSPVSGIGPLKDVIRAKLKQDNGVDVSELQDVVVTAGANMGFLNALLAITEPGDEVVLFSPYYFNHEMAITMLGCTPVCVPLDDTYTINVEQLTAHLSPRTKAIVTVSPNNPTGTVYAKELLKTINELCAQRGLYHISDEAYEYFVYDGVNHFSPASIPGSEKHTISLFSLSKSYGFAGWRIGYMLIPRSLSLAIAKAQDTNLICPTLASQHAAIGALKAGSAYPEKYLAGLQDVRDLVGERLAALGASCSFSIPAGAFYFMIKLDTDRSSLDVVEYLIRKHKIALIPGIAFGMENGCYLRIAFGALQKDSVSEGMDRLVEGLKGI